MMMLTEKDLQVLEKSALKAARAAGEYIQSQFNQQYEKMQKDGGHSAASQVVTAVDLKAQEIILQHLQTNMEQYNIGLLTEEATDDQSRLEKNHFWCVDPMDGTLAFTEGRTGYSVSIALVSHSGDPLVGVVYVPDLQDIYAVVRRAGVKLNGKQFKRGTIKNQHDLQVYMDQSMKTEQNYDQLIQLITEKAKVQGKKMTVRFGFGAVRNALATFQSDNACYFKFPKKQKGGGSIWDYAATRLFFEELGLQVSTIAGNTLHLNNPHNTFMNESGVLYATSPDLADLIIELSRNRN